jgi:hypothetical protein
MLPFMPLKIQSVAMPAQEEKGASSPELPKATSVFEIIE